MTYHRGMISPQQLRDRLRAMPNIRAVARMAGIPEKTVYRTANGETTPSLEKAQRMWNAITTIEAQIALASKHVAKEAA